ncbi:hypothetical protein [Mesonia maritima]|uniref:T9SS C-terminal target domain-containing protein n=1 Tax=Mesonia maritima TaxID=1793873 RepID=A0ABU1K6Z8_9FLAO|nr:hypothetical protein [Mesonia maritima]MDR6301086.1 hypothetical protein [Mesonia maritima]
MRLLISSLLFFLSLSTFAQSVTKLAELPKDLEEISGIEKLTNSSLIWGINDSGNEPIVYGFSEEGEIEQEVEIENAENVDWEDLATDFNGTLFIGDFGNNDNNRKNLSIYIVKNFLHQGEKAKAEKINFTFEDQKKFPAKKGNRNFGSEAFIYKDGYLYIFTKNRTKHSDGTVNLYKIPAQAGTYQAKKIDTYKTCDNNRHGCWITAASINKENTEILLLSEEKIWRIKDFKNDHFFNGNIESYTIEGNQTQKESICFKNENTAYLADEENGDEGRNLYEFTFSDK